MRPWPTSRLRRMIPWPRLFVPWCRAASAAASFAGTTARCGGSRPVLARRPSCWSPGPHRRPRLGRRSSRRWPLGAGWSYTTARDMTSAILRSSSRSISRSTTSPPSQPKRAEAASSSATAGAACSPSSSHGRGRAWCRAWSSSTHRMSRCGSSSQQGDPILSQLRLAPRSTIWPIAKIESPSCWSRHQQWPRTRREQQPRIVRSVPDIVPDAGHYIHLDRPRLVIHAIDEVVAAARRSLRHPSPFYGRLKPL